MVLILGPERSDPIGGSGYLSSGAFDGLLFLQIQTVVCGQQENDTRNLSCSASKLPFNLPLRAKQTNERLFLYYLLYPWWSNVTVHYAQRWSSVSDDVVYVYYFCRYYDT